MNFVDAIKSGFTNYVGFSGRAARSEYWYWTLFSIIASVLAGMLDSIIGMGFIGAVVSLALLLPGIAVGVRRLHDLNQSGWWFLLVMFVWGAFCWKGTTGPNRFGPDPLEFSPMHATAGPVTQHG